MIKEVATDLAKEELTKLTWRVNLNLGLIILFIFFVGTLSVYGWRLFTGLKEHQDIKDDIRDVRKEISDVRDIARDNSSNYKEIKNLLIWIQSDVLVMKSSIANKEIKIDPTKMLPLAKEPPKIIYQTIVQDSKGDHANGKITYK